MVVCSVVRPLIRQFEIGAFFVAKSYHGDISHVVVFVERSGDFPAISAQKTLHVRWKIVEIPRTAGVVVGHAKTKIVIALIVTFWKRLKGHVRIDFGPVVAHAQIITVVS